MNRGDPKNLRILAIAPSTRGFGFSVLEGERLIDWGVKSVKGDKNKQSLLKIKEMISRYHPGVLVFEDYSAKGSRRSPRIRKVRVKLFSRQQVRKAFFADGQGTKDVLADMLAKQFPEELGFRLPPKRRPWMSEAYQMGIFEAVALVLIFRQRT
jgi:hypothetical protein